MVNGEGSKMEKYGERVKRAKDLLRRSQQEFEAGRFSKAKKFLEKAIIKDPFIILGHLPIDTSYPSISGERVGGNENNPEV